jgi:hypothetical protein
MEVRKPSVETLKAAVSRPVATSQRATFCESASIRDLPSGLNASALSRPNPGLPIVNW